MNNNQDADLGGIYSWPAIIIAFIIFWPVGLYLLFKKVSLDRKAAMKAGGKGLKIAGIVLIVIASLGMIGSFDNAGSIDVTVVVIFAFFLLGGILLLLRANKISKDAKNVKKYLMIIVNSGERKIDNIASAMGKGFDDTKRDIENMISKGFLKNAYINISTREVVLPNAPVASSVASTTNVSQQTTVRPTTTASYSRPVQAPQIITCECCGANNVVTGPIGECEYCRRPLVNNHKR